MTRRTLSLALGVSFLLWATAHLLFGTSGAVLPTCAGSGPVTQLFLPCTGPR